MKTTLRMKKLAAAAILAFGSISAAQATDYITNGTFSDNSFDSQTGWTVNSNAYYFLNNAYLEGNVYGSGSLSQSIIDPIGAILTLSFDYSGNYGYQTTVWDNIVLGTVYNPSSPQTYTYNVIGTGNDVLTFFGRNDPSYNSLSNVSLTGTPVVAAVPEPESYGMMLAGLGLMGFMVRRKKSA